MTAFEQVKEDLENNIEAAYKNILVLLNPSTYGYEDYRDEFKEFLQTSLIELSKIKKRIK